MTTTLTDRLAARAMMAAVDTFDDDAAIAAYAALPAATKRRWSRP